LELWLRQPDLDAGLRGELEALRAAAEGDPEAAAELADRFYRDLEFGTAGMRGVLGAGRNRMNVHTVRRITQGFADHVNAKKRAPGARPSVAIAYDNRIYSDRFAFETACVLLANGINARVYPQLAPTPALSFAVRHCGCDAGVMITASHNTREYNGYKVYDRTGGQCLPEEADAIAARIAAVDLFRDVKSVSGRFEGSFPEKLAAAAAAFKNGGGGPSEKSAGGAWLEVIGEDVNEAFIEAVLALSMGKRDFSGLSVAYTPLNGTGSLPVRRALDRIGLKNLHIVREQEAPDGNFPTCPYPNPEKKEALSLGLALCEKLRAEGRAPDLLLATDPDCDRVGVAALHEGAYRLLNGNEVGILLIDFICEARKAAGTMPERPVAVKTIVSSPMAAAVAAAYGVETVNVLTGFKFIGEQITLLEKEGEAGRYIFGFEESCGYLSGAHVRDKDAVNACLLIAEMAAARKSGGLDLVDRLEALYKKHGFYESSLLEFTMEGAEGMARIGRVMAALRRAPAGGPFKRPAAEFADYLSSVKRRTGGAEETLRLPKADVLEYLFDGGSSVIVRPSGTEPKLKIYLDVSGETREASRRAAAELGEDLKRIINGIE
jgi:phosphoglucomutase